MPKISVISAIYNAQKTIVRCIDSILGQSFHDFELLLIDDGSTDNSGKICDDFARKDNRIRVIHKKNEGVAATRECGMNNSRGQYVIHIDPDDWIEHDTLELLYNTAINNNASITICDYQLILSDGKKYMKQCPTSMTSEAMMNDILEGRLLGGVCNKLIHKNLIGGGNFTSGIDYCEDVLYLAKICSNKQVPVAYVNKPLYNYDKSAATSITSGRVTRKKYESQRAFYHEIQKVMPHLTNFQKSVIVGELSLKAFAGDLLSAKEFYLDFHKERANIRTAPINNKIKPLILLSTYGVYPVCRWAYKAYLRFNS